MGASGNRIVWICQGCYDDLDEEREVFSMENLANETCVLCDKDGDHAIGERTILDELDSDRMV